MAQDIPSWLPLAYGFIAGVTVLIGAWTLYTARGRLSDRKIGFLQALAGGILAYIALEVGGEVAEYMEELATPETFWIFLRDAVLTTAAFAGTFLALTAVERRAHARRMSPSFATAFIVAFAYGLHNVGEGFAIAAAFLTGAVANAVLYTTAFAIHNATEGFGIAGPLLADRGANATLATLTALSLMAGLPILPGVITYYAQINSPSFIALLNTVAAASLIYALLHVNLSAMSKLGGVASPKFWLAITAGTAVAFATESILLLSMTP